jgi:hypothetical protein
LKSIWVTLFTGDAGSGESNSTVIIENDWLEAIIAPPSISFTTPYSDLYLVVTNRKPEHGKERNRYRCSTWNRLFGRIWKE